VLLFLIRFADNFPTPSLPFLPPPLLDELEDEDVAEEEEEELDRLRLRVLAFLTTEDCLADFLRMGVLLGSVAGGGRTGP